MSCLDIALPGALTNPAALPRAYPDALMSEGTLMLWEPAHPADPFVGVPTAPVALSGAGTITVMPNIAETVAQELTGETDVSPRFIRDDGATVASNTDMLIERTSKGGLHIITSQATMATFRVAKLVLPDSIREYLFDNPSHQYFLSAWYRVTRVAASNNGPYIAVMNDAGASSGFFNVGQAGNLGDISPLASAISRTRNTLGVTCEQIANTYDGTALSAASNLLSVLFGFGYVNPAYGDHGRNKSMSAVLYRIVLEDLTASGRAFAQVKARDDALFAQPFASGGRYEGDTFTAVSSLP